MKKIILILIVVIIFINGCQKAETKENELEAITLSELQVTACNSADEGGTCDTKLEDLGIVGKEECCQTLGKCCS